MERKPARAVAIAAAVIVGLLAAYPASVGPAGFLVTVVDWQSLGIPAFDIFNRLYSPLFWLPDPLGNWMIEWLDCGTSYGNYLRTR